MTALFVERENEILRVVRSFTGKGLKFVVVGGYAVSGLARHRFPVDLDVVIDEKDLESFARILDKRGFKKHIEKEGFDEVYGGKFISYIKEVKGLPITVDLLVGSLVCRSTGASWGYEYIIKHSVLAEISGIEFSFRCRVPERELLIALKIYSGRRADLGDVVVLLGGADVNRIIRHLRRGNLARLKNQIDHIIEMLKDPKFLDSIKGVFSIQKDVVDEIQRAHKVLRRIRESI